MPTSLQHLNLKRRIMKKIKVLVVGLTSGVGGVENFICTVNRFIDKNCFQMDYLVHQGIHPKYEKDLKQNGATIYRVRGIKEGIVPFLREILAFYRKHSDYDIVHLNECGASFFIYAFPVFLHPKMKLIVHSHNGDSQRKELHYFFRFFQNLRTNACWACSDIAGIWMFGKEKKCTIIHNGIPLSQYRYQEESRRHLRDVLNIRDCFVLGSVARFEKQKNHAQMIQIFSSYKAINPNSRLVLVGGGGERENIEHMVQERNLQNDVLFLGIRDDIPALLSLFDVFFLPSLYEGLPFVAIEAQAASLPMLVSDTVSREIDLTSLITRVDLKADDSVWVNSIEKIRNAPIDRNAPIYQEELACAGYDIEDSVSRIQQLYEELSRRGNK